MYSKKSNRQRAIILSASLSILGVLSTAMIGCESTQSSQRSNASQRIFSPNHVHGYRTSAGSTNRSTNSGPKAGVFSPNHIHGYDANLSGQTRLNSPTRKRPTHVNGF